MPSSNTLANAPRPSEGPNGLASTTLDSRVRGNDGRIPVARPPSLIDAASCGVRALGSLLPGLILTAGLAVASIAAARLPWLQAHGISALTLAIVFGIVAGNTFYPRIAWAGGAGVAFSRQNLLRLGIVLYGLRLTFQDIGNVGVGGVLIDATVLCSTFGFAWLIGTRVFGLDRNTAMLIGAGSSICGAAAVMAVGPVVRGRAEQVTVAVSTVVVFGTLAIFLYPALYRLNAAWHWMAMSPTAYGVFAGSTVHEVAQVVAAGRSIGEDAANTAVIAKMVRVMMLAPFLIALSAYLARSPTSGEGRGATRRESSRSAPRSAPKKAARIVIPWFALGFIAVAGFNSLALLPEPVVGAALDVDTFLLAMAMAGLGLGTHVSAIRRAGIKPLALAGVLFAWLIGGGLVINHFVAAWFA